MFQALLSALYLQALQASLPKNRIIQPLCGTGKGSLVAIDGIYQAGSAWRVHRNKFCGQHPFVRMPWMQLLRIVSFKRNPPLTWNLSMTGNFLCSKIISNSRYIIAFYITCCALPQFPRATLACIYPGGVRRRKE